MSILLLVSLIAPATPQAAPVHPERLLAKVRAGGDASAAERSARARLLRSIDAIGWRVLEVEPGRLLAARDELQASGAFERVDFDRARRLAHVPNDPYWPQMWNLQKIRADLAWDTHKGAPSVVVAVMDTGLDRTHPDLSANAWTNAGEIAGNGLDDDANGYVDDVHGYDFAYDDGEPDDVYGHGTSCAGIVAAAQDNGIGVTGVAPLCRLAGVKAALDSGYFYDSANVPALVYCADMGFEVVSMSFYSDEVTPAERDAIDYCWSKGTLPVGAAGNDDSVLPFYPGAYENVLAVAATSPSDTKSWFSNWGSWVDVAAPGEGLPTVTLGAGYTTGFAGTSGATPHVAGLAGLLFAANPGATNADVRAAIEDTALTLSQPPYGELTGYGRIDCVDALARVLGQSSGSKPAKLRFVSPCGGGPTFLPASWPAHAPPTLYVGGVGFEAPNLVRVLRGGVELPILAQERTHLDTRMGSNLPSSLQVEVNGASVADLRWDGGMGWIHAPSDAGTSTFGAAQAVGGFRELYRVDGQHFTCTQSGGVIEAQFALRHVAAPVLGAMRLEFTRKYSGVSGAESVAFYDWSTASYPYGSWATVLTTPVSGGGTLATFTPLGPNPERFLDDEGTLYVTVTTTGAGAAALLSVDALRVRVH